ncbi:adenylylsulfatase HINT3 isoform X2 [Raphanus sativus]|uniref:Adenylylsulfatase HINT3 isoform X2 n=1 Tax=Raphanus sativus TaxID=3726 RepID=A0A9W3CFK8_RAPSA|nr:adenylylsulfatase HINT3 isoform X2 [Raphanus sativus]
MEARRLGILCSHLNPSSPYTTRDSILRASDCTSGSTSDEKVDSSNLQNDCVFCKIVRGESPSLKVVAAMCSKVPLISNAIVKATDSDSFNLLVNNGAAAGQVIFHTHIHIIPRKERDCLWASESLRRHTMKLDKEATQLALRIREQLCSVPKEQMVQPSS